MAVHLALAMTFWVPGLGVAHGDPGTVGKTPVLMGHKEAWRKGEQSPRRGDGDITLSNQLSLYRFQGKRNSIQTHSPGRAGPSGSRAVWAAPGNGGPAEAGRPVWKSGEQLLEAQILGFPCVSRLPGPSLINCHRNPKLRAWPLKGQCLPPPARCRPAMGSV